MIPTRLAVTFYALGGFVVIGAVVVILIFRPLIRRLASKGGDE